MSLLVAMINFKTVYIIHLFPGLVLKDKLGHLHSSPVYTQHLPYSQSSSYFNTRDHSSLHDLVPSYVLPPTSSYSSSFSSSTQPLASSYSVSSSRQSPSYTASRDKRRLALANQSPVLGSRDVSRPISMSEMVTVADGDKPFKLREAGISQTEPRTYQQLIRQMGRGQMPSVGGFWETLLKRGEK